MVDLLYPKSKERKISLQVHMCTCMWLVPQSLASMSSLISLLKYIFLRSSITWAISSYSCRSERLEYTLVLTALSSDLGGGRKLYASQLTKPFYYFELFTSLPSFSIEDEMTRFWKRIFLFSTIRIFKSHWQFYSTAQQQLLDVREHLHPNKITQGREV